MNIRKGLQVVLYYGSRMVVQVYESDLARRAFHTAWQTGLTVWALSEFNLDFGVLAGVAGAGLSAAKTVFVQALNEYRS